MLRTSRLICFLVLVNVVFSGGCGVSTSAPPPVSEPTFPVVVFSDIHFNPLDDPTLCHSLDAADPSDWAGILQGSLKPPALPPLHTDTNYLLLRLALSGIKQNLGASPVVIFAGDLLVHKISSLYYESCDGLTAGQTPTAQQVLAMQAFADKTATFVMQQTRTAVGSVPVMFVVGNNDSYTGLGPDSIYLANTVEPYYAKFVNGTAADYPAFFNTFTNGGYYLFCTAAGIQFKDNFTQYELVCAPYPRPSLATKVQPTRNLRGSTQLSTRPKPRDKKYGC